MKGNRFRWLYQWKKIGPSAEDDANHVFNAVGHRNMSLRQTNMAGFLDGTEPWLIHLGLFLYFDPWLFSRISSSSLHFFKNNSLFPLCLIYLECQIFMKKSSSATELYITVPPSQLEPRFQLHAAHEGSKIQKREAEDKILYYTK